MPAWAFMWALAFAIFAGLKWLTWWQARGEVSHPAWRSAAYLLAWPGMDAEAFLDPQQRPRKPPAKEWPWAVGKTLLAIALLWTIVRRIPAPLALLRGWVGMLGLVLLLHFGSFHLMALLWQALGIEARPIMMNPLASSSLSEFWGKRWNLGFRQLSYDFIFRPLYKTVGAPFATFVVFLASGLIHDLVISVPARGGYGLPTAYFVVQGLGVLFERSGWGRRIGVDRGVRGWLFLVCVVGGPAFWLFHPPFVREVILPFMQAVHAL